MGRLSAGGAGARAKSKVMPKLSFSVYWCRIKSWRQSVWGEVGKDSFYCFAGQGEPSRLMPSRHMSPLGKVCEKFYSNCSKEGVIDSHGHASDGVVVS